MDLFIEIVGEINISVQCLCTLEYQSLPFYMVHRRLMATVKLYPARYHMHFVQMISCILSTLIADRGLVLEQIMS